MVRNAQRAVRRASGRRKAWLRQAINHLEKLIGRTERVVDQARSRLAGVMPDSSSRLVSLHDADARPIRKGRLGKPVEFGYKAQVVDNADGVILDHSVELGKPRRCTAIGTRHRTDQPPHRTPTTGSDR